jgi:DNA-binding protein HU-beta
VNKAELIVAVAAELGDKRTSEQAVEAIIDTITRSVVAGEKVTILDFGVFEKRPRAARTARNPATGAPVKLKATSVPKFRPAQHFKDVVSGAKKPGK